MHGICVPVTRIVSTEDVDDNGERINKRFKINLLLFYNGDLRSEEDAALSELLHRIKDELESGKKIIDDYTQSEKKLIKQCLEVTTDSDNVAVEFIQNGIDQRSVEHGTFAFMSSMHQEPEQGLIQYRKRGEIEDEFQLDKEDLLGEMTGCSSDEVLDGKLFTRFVALCMAEGLRNELHKMQNELGKQNEDPVHDLTNPDAEKRLHDWLEDRSIKRILAWFDTNDRIIVSKKFEAKKWNSEVLARDRLFLSKLGINVR